MRHSRQPGPGRKASNKQQVEYWTITRLRPGPKVRKHSEEQIERIASSIQQFGFMSPPLINEDGEIIAGVARVEAARRLGYDELPVLVSSDLSPAQIKAYRIADNKLAELASWDREVLKLEFECIADFDVTFDLTFTGFDTPAIDLVLNPPSTEPLSADDESPSPAPETVSRIGDVWRLGLHRLGCGDALSPAALAPLLADGAARLVLSDVPYNVPIDGHVGGLGKVQHREFVQAAGEMTAAEFENFLRTAIALALTKLMEGGLAGFFIDWRSVETMLRVGRELGLTLLNLVVWNKSNGGMGSLYRSKHELLCLFKKGKAPHVNNVQLGANGRYRSNVWDYAGVNSFGAGRMEQLAAHPTVKPAAMIADALMDVTHRGEIVLDPFVGSGTAIIAAQTTGRVARGLDLDPAYVDVAIRRFETRFGIPAVHDATGLSFTALAEQRRGEAQDAHPALTQPPVRVRSRATLVPAQEI